MSAPDRGEGSNATILRALVHGRTLFTMLMFCIFAGMVYVATGYTWPANFLPFVIGIPGMALSLLQVVIDVGNFLRAEGRMDPRTDFEKYMDELTARTGGIELEITKERLQTIVEDPSIEARSRNKREIVLFGYFFFLVAAVLLFGFWIGTPVFLFLFLRFYAKETLRFSVLLTAGVWVAMYGLLVVLLEQILWEGFATKYIMDTYFIE